MERHAFVMSTPVTILLAMNFVIVNDLDADALVPNSFKNAQEIAGKLAKTGIFRNVYFLDDVLLTYPITVKKCARIVVNGWKTVHRLKNTRYDYMYYCNTGWLINSIFYTASLKGNWNCKQRFIEHGFPFYLRYYGKNSILLRLLINLSGFHCMDGSMLEKFYFFEPQLLKVHQDGEICRMDKINWKNERFRNAVNSLYDWQDAVNKLRKKTLIIMEQPPQKVAFDIQGFWRAALEGIDKEKVIVKPHPRQKQSMLGEMGIDVCSGNNIPWEIIQMNLDMENKMQVGIFSASCLQAKYCFGMESTVILLYKLVPAEYLVVGEDTKVFANDLGSLYEDKSKFFVPETIEEFRGYLKEHGLMET